MGEEAQSAGSREGQEGRNLLEMSPVGLMGQAMGTVLPYRWLVESSTLFWAPSCLPVSWMPRTGAGGSPLASGCPQLQKARKRRVKAR